MKSYTKDFTKLAENLEKISRLTIGYKNPVFFKDLYQDEVETFFYLAESGPKTMKELAGYISVKPNVMTGIATRLQKRQLVSRFEDLKDRRKVWLQIAPKWQQAYQMYIKEQEKISQIIIETIGEENVIKLTTMLSKAIDKLNEMPVFKRSV